MAKAIDKFVVNEDSEVTHVVAVRPRHGAVSAGFLSRCGWSFSGSNFRLSATGTAKRCKKCFKDGESSSDDSEGST